MCKRVIAYATEKASRSSDKLMENHFSIHRYMGPKYLGAAARCLNTYVHADNFDFQKVLLLILS